MDVAGAPDLKDAMVAVVGGGIALGGLLLIFVGFLFCQAAALAYSSKPAPKAMTQKYRTAAIVGIVPFAVALGTAIAAILYWFFPGDALARGIIIGFAARKFSV